MGQNGTNRDINFPPHIGGAIYARNADRKTVRLCADEQQAVRVSIHLSGLTVREIALRCGRGKSTVQRWADGTRVPDRLVSAFCSATGTNLLRQFRELEIAERDADGRMRKHDRIAAIAAPTQLAWSAAA